MSSNNKDRQLQIEAIKDIIDSVYGCDCAYYDVDGLAIAAAIYDAGFKCNDSTSEKKSCDGCKHIGFRYPYASMYPCICCTRANSKDYYNVDIGEV